MVTAQQLTDIENQLRKITPSGSFGNTYIGRIIAALVNTGRISTDVTFNNDDVLADLTGLVSKTLDINSTYDIELLLRVESVSTTPGAEIKFVIPSGATLKWDVGYPADVLAAENTEATTQAIATIAGIGLVAAKGTLRMGATAGTIQVQGAQATATVEDTSYLEDSILKVTKVA